MLDDIEDGSPLRRSKPATHCVFGTAQTINSANFQFVESLDVVRKELGSECLGVYAEELRLLHIGQSLDLHWTSQVKCPSMAEYMKMIDYSELDVVVSHSTNLPTNNRHRNRRTLQNAIQDVGSKLHRQTVSHSCRFPQNAGEIPPTDWFPTYKMSPNPHPHDPLQPLLPDPRRLPEPRLSRCTESRLPDSHLLENPSRIY
jgi:hypothetical protein